MENSKKIEESTVSAKQQSSKRGLIPFFLITLSITWICWIIAMQLLLKYDYPLMGIDTYPLRFPDLYTDARQFGIYLLFIIGTWGPMLSAIIVISKYHSKEYRKAYFKSFLKFKVHYKWYMIIIAIPLSISLINFALSAAMSIDISGAFVFDLPWYIYITMFIDQIFTSGLEEPGWRGYATPEMQKSKNAYDSGFYIGIVWGIWHFPFIIQMNILNEVPIAIMIPSLIGYVFLIVPMSIISVWIYNNTESIGLMILSHSLNNFIAYVIMGNVNNLYSGWIIAITTWIIASLITKKYGKETLKNSSEKEN